MANKRSITGICSAILALALFISCLGVQNTLPVYAMEKEYTDVLADLQIDEWFDIEEYPEVEDDYSVQVIQIAESADGELFLYTYQPSNVAYKLTASEINMSLSESVYGTQLYKLTLLNTNGVFCKYRVEGITVSSEFYRYYNISSIYRPWDEDIDEDTGNDNTKDAIAYPVGTLYRAKTENGEVTYSSKKTDIITILKPYVDYLEYSNGFKFFPDWCNSHYIAFTTDKQIDTLMEADVFYISRSASVSYYAGSDGETAYGEPEEHIAPLNGTQKGSNAADGFLAKKYEWERIQTTKDFIASEDLKDGTIKNLEGTEWVLRFAETEVSMVTGTGFSTTSWTEISEVTILRLKFVTDGKLYNLGTVSDKLTGDNTPGNNNTNEFATLWEWLSRITGLPEWAWKLIFVIVILAIALPILSAVFPVVGQVLMVIFKGIGTAVMWLFKGLWWLICLPFKGIAALVQRIKDKREGG